MSKDNVRFVFEHAPLYISMHAQRKGQAYVLTRNTHKKIKRIVFSTSMIYSY